MVIPEEYLHLLNYSGSYTDFMDIIHREVKPMDDMSMNAKMRILQSIRFVINQLLNDDILDRIYVNELYILLHLYIDHLDFESDDVKRAINGIEDAYEKYSDDIRYNGLLFSLCLSYLGVKGVTYSEPTDVIDISSLREDIMYESDK
jgi:hypothetical protein